MNFNEIEPRTDWQETVRDQGLVYAMTDHPDGSVRPYWNESMYYSFGVQEIDELETATNELHAMAVGAAEYVLGRTALAERMGIPDYALPRIRQSWDQDEPSLYGRFDLSYDQNGNIKMLEYNADTPTSLVEAAVIQWLWKEDVKPNSDQWNSIHERIVARWGQIMRSRRVARPVVHFASVGKDESWEDYMTISYLRDTAEEAGVNTIAIPTMGDIGWLNSKDPRFKSGWVDHEGRHIDTIFKLYAWEWLTSNDPDETSPAFREAITSTTGPNTDTLFVEPIWKMLLSNKGILPVMWQLNEGHPLLLPSYFEEDKPSGLKDFVRKPKLSREGANVSIVTGETILEQKDGEYGYEGHVVQEFHRGIDFELANKDRVYPILGSWVVAGEAAGVGVRQARNGRITTNLSEFVPHVIE